jgi:hypothetical protein
MENQTKTPAKPTRRGQRAPGQTMLGVSMSEALKRDIAKIAKRNCVSSAEWARECLQSRVYRSTAASKGASK